MSTATRSPDLLSTAKVCELFGIHPNTCRRYCIEGKLPARKIGQRWYISRPLLMGMFGMGETYVPDDGEGASDGE